MILDILAGADRYFPLHPLFAEAFRFLRRPDLAQLPSGRHSIDGERLFAIVAREPARSREGSQLETHERYIDIQHVLAGTDVMGWLPKSECTQPAGDYDAERDLRFYLDSPRTWVAVNPGAYAVFFPTDAHLPLTGEGEIHKIVVKVAVA